MDNCEVKLADFGLSALVRLDEDGYDAEESGKRKRYTHLKEVRILAYLHMCNISVMFLVYVILDFTSYLGCLLLIFFADYLI